MSLSQGNITVSDGYKATYAASWAAFVPATNFMFSIKGSATKIVKVLRVGISATQTTASALIIKVGTLTSIGGSPVSIAPTGIVAYDSTSPAATATPLVYTTGFAALSTFLVAESVYLTIPVPAVINPTQNEYVFDYSTDFNQTMILNSTGNYFVMQFPSSPTGLSASMWVEWTEE